MGWFTAFVVWMLIWWVTLFAVLPFGVRPDPEPDGLTGWRGAPIRTRVGRIVLVTTAVSLVLWIGCMVVISHRDWLSFRQGWLAMPAK